VTVSRRSYRFLESIGESLLGLFEAVADFVWLMGRTFRTALTPPYSFSLLFEQFFRLIVRSAPLVLFTAASIGTVMALQFGYGMERFGGKLYVPTVVSVSIVRVLGPLFTCLMLAGRAGAGIAAELGSMAVTQQVDAVRAMGTDPIRKLVVPRVIVLMVGAPLLTLLADVVGIAGGMLVSTTGLGMPASLYLQKSFAALALSDVIVGTGKTVLFGMFIAFISCSHGLRTRDGTVGIGASTTSAVVMSSIVIMLGDVFVTKLSWVFKW